VNVGLLAQYLGGMTLYECTAFCEQTNDYFGCQTTSSTLRRSEQFLMHGFALFNAM
jgi:hypothetical protein